MEGQGHSVRTPACLWILSSCLCELQIGVTVLFSIWGIATLSMVVTLIFAIKKAIRMHVVVDKDNDGVETIAERMQAAEERMEGFLHAIADMSIIGSSLRLLLIMVPFPFYNGIFITCWNCYDFEAAAAHELGHLLGLGHPDLAPGETISGYPTLGQNSYHADLAAGIPFNETTCLDPWAGVKEGTPPGASVDPDSLTRPSIMGAFTTHNPRVCLTEDDLEAINVLYPDCHGGPIVPVCAKASLNIGWLRAFVYIGGPFFLSLFIAIVLHYCADRQLKKRRQRRENPEVQIKWKTAVKDLLSRGFRRKVDPKSKLKAAGIAAKLTTTTRLMPTKESKSDGVALEPSSTASAAGGDTAGDEEAAEVGETAGAPAAPAPAPAPEPEPTPEPEPEPEPVPELALEPALEPAPESAPEPEVGPAKHQF